MALRITAAVTAALALFALGSIFGLNGAQWDWWRWASWAGAAVVLLGAVAPPKLLPAGSTERRGRSVLAGAAGGAAVVSGSTVVMADRYSDPYSGPLFWPHALAVLAFVGFTVLVGNVIARRG